MKRNDRCFIIFELQVTLVLGVITEMDDEHQHNIETTLFVIISCVCDETLEIVMNYS